MQGESPPPPSALPTRLSRVRIAKESAGPQPPQPPPSKWRELPADPQERAEARKSVAGEASSLIEMASGLASALPPYRPFDEIDREMIRVPLEETLYKYGSNIDPALTLAIACGMIAFRRRQEYREKQKAEANKSVLTPAA